MRAEGGGSSLVENGLVVLLPLERDRIPICDTVAVKANLLHYQFRNSNKFCPSTLRSFHIPSRSLISPILNPQALPVQFPKALFEAVFANLPQNTHYQLHYNTIHYNAKPHLLRVSVSVLGLGPRPLFAGTGGGEVHEDECKFYAFLLSCYT